MGLYGHAMTGVSVGRGEVSASGMGEGGESGWEEGGREWAAEGTMAGARRI